MTAPTRTWPHLLAALLRGGDLTADDTRWAMRAVMDDDHEPVALAGFLVALARQGREPRRAGAEVLRLLTPQVAGATP